MSKCIKGVGVLLIVGLSLISIVLSSRVLLTSARSNGIPCWDLRLRYDEMQCMQSGVDPYDVFIGKVSSLKYRGLPRRDVPIDHDASKQMVCAYPAWHTAFCYFYGWLPWPVMHHLAIVVNSAFLVFMILFTWRALNKHSRVVRCACVILQLGVFSRAITYGYLSGNYGFLMMFLSVALAWALRKEYDYLAGICWAIMMFKPQVGLLFVFPLFFSRRYKTIVTSVSLCLIGLWIATFITGKNALDLLLQIPNSVPPPDPLFGLSDSVLSTVAYLRMLIGMLLCGGVCYFLRGCKTWYEKIVPVLVFIPIWNYSAAYDYVILWLFTTYMLERCLSSYHPTPIRTAILLLFAAWTVVAIFNNNFAMGKVVYSLYSAGSKLLFYFVSALYRILPASIILLVLLDERHEQRNRVSQ